jgi:hypothetical protein
MAQIIRHVHVAVTAGEGIGAVAAGAHVAEAYVLAGELALKQRFHPTVMLHAIGKAVAENSHDIVLFKREGDRGFRGGWFRGGDCFGFGGFGFWCLGGWGIFSCVIVGGDGAFKTGIHFGLDAFGMRTATERIGLERTDEGDVQIGFDGIIETKRPEAAVQDEAAIAFVGDVLGGAVKRCENATFLAGSGFVRARPFGRHRGFGGVRRGIGSHSIERLGHGEDFAAGWFADVAANLHPDVFHTTKDRVGFLFFNDRDAGALFVVLSVVSDPCLAEDLMAETVFVIFILGIIRILGERIGGTHFESMRGGAESDDRAAAVEIVVEVFHLFLRESLEPEENNGEIGGIKSFEARHVRVARNDFAAFGVDVEKHGAFESVMFGKDPCEGGQGFLGTVFVVTRHEYDVFAFAKAFGALVDEWCGTRERGK